MIRWLTVVACLFVAASPARAADPPPQYQVSAGWAWLDETDWDMTSSGGSSRFPVGWVASVTRHLTGPVGVTGEIGGHYKTLSTTASLDGQAMTADFRFRVYSFMGGPSVALRRDERFTPFAHFLVGAVHQVMSVDINGVEVPANAAEAGGSETDFAWQPGGGVDVAWTKKAALRLQIDLRGVRGPAETSHEFRFMAGVTLGL